MEEKAKQLDQTVIGVERGVQKLLALRWDLSPSTITRYLNGCYRENDHVELIMQVREDAKRISAGRTIYVVKNQQDNTLRYFSCHPRRDRLLGKWFDPCARAAHTEREAPLFDPMLLPEGVWPEWDGAPIKILIKAIR